MFGGQQGISAGDFKARVNAISASGGAARAAGPRGAARSPQMTTPLCLCDLQRKADSKKK